MAKSKESPQRRRLRVRAQVRAAALQEAKLQKALEAELLRVTQAAATAYPKWGGVIPRHKAALESILAASLGRTSVNAAALARELTSKPLAASAGMEKFLPTAEELRATVLEKAASRAAKRASEISETTRTRIHNSIVRGLEVNDSPAQIAQRIREEVDDMTRARARTIARTETASAQQSGEFDEMSATSEALDMPMTKTWVATEDERTRDSHSAADGQTVDLDEMFEVGEASLKHPSDPDGPAEEVINCRCAVVYQPK